MSTIRVKCNDQALMFLECPVVASGGIEETKVAFDFCSKWDGYAKTAIFYQDRKNVYYALLDGSNTCVVPWEVTRKKGHVYFGVFGEMNGVTRTSEVLKFRVTEGAIIDGARPSDPTPDIYAQILSAYDTVKATAESAEGKATNAVETANTAASTASNANNTAEEALEKSNTHASNKNNPHNVTAEQVGARPNTWLPSLSDIGAAPSGYGLGGNGEPKNWSEIDNLIANGKYQISNINQTINGIPVVSATLEVVFYGYNYGKQILRTVEAASGSGASYTLERSRGYGGWEPWECANPPMVPGVEYRTTERENGEVKYVKRIDFGTLPNNTSKHISLGVAANRIRKISATARTGTTARTLPFETVDGYKCDIYLDGINVGIHTNFIADDHTASVTIWYV